MVDQRRQVFGTQLLSEAGHAALPLGDDGRQLLVAETAVQQRGPGATLSLGAVTRSTQVGVQEGRIDLRHPGNRDARHQSPGEEDHRL